MNKTITMNLGGIIFHIEIDAYEMLNNYLNTIKGYFNNSEGKEEIMSDIESRIAEMLLEKISTSKQAILLVDINNVISLMGKPEDFATESTSENTSNKNEFENNEFKFSQAENKRRRVFRDKDENILGGVCAGIANYFGFDPLWLRGVFALSFFLFGTGFLLYIILWIIIPEAKTTAEKLEMRGEKVDMHNIGKVVNDEFEDFKKRMKDFGEKTKSNETKENLKSSTQKFIEFVGDVFQNIVKVVGKIIAVFAVFVGVALIVGLLATIFGRGTISVFGLPGNSLHFSLYEFAAAVFPENLSIVLVVIASILFFGVPLIMLIYAGIRLLFGIKLKNKIIKYVASTLWLIGLGLIIYIAFEIGKDFSSESFAKQKMELVQPKSQILYLDMKSMPDDELDVTYKHKRKVRLGDWSVIARDENDFRLCYPMLDIKLSETDSFQLEIIKSANGFDKREANTTAKNIDYCITQTDSTIYFNGFYKISKTDKFRAQAVKLILKVPVNKIIFIGRKMEKIIFDIDNINNALDNEMTKRRWRMTRQGLECVDCKGLDETDTKINNN